MGFDEGGIILDREDETYYAGQVLRGRLEFDLSNVKTFRGIYVEFIGFCKVHWTTSHSRRENDRTVHYTVPHDSYEEYVNLTTYLVGSKSGENKLFPGRHAFPFEFQIPPHCPSSFESSDGHVRYQVKVTVDRAFKLDQHKTAQFRVITPLDLNANPFCKEPIAMEFYNSYCCCFTSSGKSEIVVKVPAAGWCPRQVMPVEVSCKNNSSVQIDAIQFQIKKDTEFRAECEPDTRTYKDNILEVKKGPIPSHTERNWVVELEIPDMDVPNLTGCRYIEVNFKFKVSVETSGCHTDDDEVHPLIIGTIPLSAFNTQPIAAKDDIPVSHGFTSYPPPIMNPPIGGNLPYPNGQNISPYPNAINPPQNTPYPNQPYPGANPPYPGVNPPYPGANPPYPNSNPTPYPTTNVGNAPYPSQGTSPYPAPKVATNSPYPTESNTPYPNVSPYPSTTSPYPPTTSPYPPTSSPYPPTTSPYPPTSSPYPPTSSPYPPTSVPYGSSPKPEFTGTTLLKTGNLGFIAQGDKKDGVTMPLLPPSAGIPPYSTSPYASASAPVPSTPDDAGNKLPAYSSPYNPDYKEKHEEK